MLNSSIIRRFTLIELLVVISILLILAAMLMPALSSARQRAHRVVEVNDRHQIGKASILFASDNNRDFPDRGKVRFLHELRLFSANLNVVLLTDYIGWSEENRERYFFCASRLKEKRSPYNKNGYGHNHTAGYANFGTVNYYNVPVDDYAFKWDGEGPLELTSLSKANPAHPMWSCMNAEQKGNWFAHDRPIEPAPAEGAATVFADGSGAWMTADSFTYIGKATYSLKWWAPMQ
jgi:prepilin-type N-terminal cleavage/methylation domain-containing protein